MKTAPKPSARVRVRRLPKRARYDWESICAILDSAFLCHVGYVIDGQPFVTPTCYWRYDKQVLLHGSFASRMLNTVAQGIDVCVTVSIADGLVLARSGFHHSINYRAAMLFGRAHPLVEEADKRTAMEAFVERFFPGRWATLRPVTRKELKATTVLTLEIDEASAKVRTGPPIDDEEDYALPIWAGVVPIESVQLPAQPDPRLDRAVGEPAHLGDLRHLGLAPRRGSSLPGQRRRALADAQSWCFRRERPDDDRLIRNRGMLTARLSRTGVPVYDCRLRTLRAGVTDVDCCRKPNDYRAGTQAVLFCAAVTHTYSV